VDRCRSCRTVERVLTGHILPVTAVVGRRNCRR
jgi:hypothetical protein